MTDQMLMEEIRSQLATLNARQYETHAEVKALAEKVHTPDKCPLGAEIKHNTTRIWRLTIAILTIGGTGYGIEKLLLS